MTDLGPCPACGKGRIRMMYSKAGKRFAGCTEWPECKQTYPLRPRGTLVPADEPCPHCGAPMLKYSKGDSCINMDCPGKKKKKTSV
jgi:DNA topoisomerase-1